VIKKVALSGGVVVMVCTVFLMGCNKVPTIPAQPPPPSGQTTGGGNPNSASTADFLDDLGCFPVGCDLPPGMKELCQDYESGTITWPASCTDMPGEAC